nr:hemagglutinin repeat-containing protein [Burkholderia anthina]
MTTVVCRPRERDDPGIGREHEGRAAAGDEQGQSGQQHGYDSTRSTNESKSASVGVSYGTGGFGVSAPMSRAHGDANSDAATQNNTHINTSNTATIISDGDTNMVGANVNANKVIVDVNLAKVRV